MKVFHLMEFLFSFLLLLGRPGVAGKNGKPGPTGKIGERGWRGMS